mmetsp:Transcript_17610/g.50089  ORF Transcript_17610/g.50089 Transcript_17610/m.50089 type:complete len:204 (-) Transcript_17610:1540-2151(-)
MLGRRRCLDVAALVIVVGARQCACRGIAWRTTSARRCWRTSASGGRVRISQPPSTCRPQRQPRPHGSPRRRYRWLGKRTRTRALRRQPFPSCRRPRLADLLFLQQAPDFFRAHACRGSMPIVGRGRSRSRRWCLQAARSPRSPPPSRSSRHPWSSPPGVWLSPWRRARRSSCLPTRGSCSTSHSRPGAWPPATGSSPESPGAA